MRLKGLMKLWESCLRRNWNVKWLYIRWANTGINTHIHTHTINICERQTHNMDFITRPYFTGRAQDYLSCLFSPNRRGDEESRGGPQAQTWKDGGTQGQTHLNTSNGEVISYLTEWNGTGVLTNFCRKIFQTSRCALQEFCATRSFCSGFKAASQFLNLSTFLWQEESCEDVKRHEEEVKLFHETYDRIVAEDRVSQLVKCWSWTYIM